MNCSRSVCMLFVILALALTITPLLAEGTNAPAGPRSAVDDFSPAAAFAVTIMAVVVVLLLGIALVIGISLFALAGGLTAFGVLCSSIAVGFVRRSAASGFCALIVQLGAVVGVPCGIVAVWLVSLLTGSHWSVVARALLGGAGGMICGIFVAWLLVAASRIAVSNGGCGVR